MSVSELESKLEGSRNHNRDLEGRWKFYEAEAQKSMLAQNTIWRAVCAWCKKHPEHAHSLKATVRHALNKIPAKAQN